MDDLSIGLQIFINALFQNPGPVGPSINFLAFFYGNPFFCFPSTVDRTIGSNSISEWLKKHYPLLAAAASSHPQPEGIAA
tara:strand:- start:479 stop:718 length:240 start_codon:yes stop_codon:yes gene_type:complete